jgi:hypothetical protein
VSGYLYDVFGLVLQANRRLPGLAPKPEWAPPDVVCEIDSASGGRAEAGPPDLPWASEIPPQPVRKASTPNGTFLRLQYAAAEGEIDFILDPTGSRVWVSSSGTATLVDVAALFLGPVLGCVLRQRGVTCLHGSVVCVNGRALAILGAKRAGKSTTALALLQRGAVLLADDLVVLAPDGQTFGVRAGPPRLRLRVEPATALCGAYESLPLLWSRAENRPRKRSLDAVQSGLDPTAIIPLAALHVLEPCTEHGGQPFVAEKPAAWSLTMLMAHRYMSYVLDRPGHARDFEILTRLAASVPVRQLCRPAALGTVPLVADLILRDARALH